MKLGGREQEVDLTGEKLVFGIERRYEIVNVKTVGTADEGIMIRLKNLRNVDGNVILTELSID